MSTIKSTIVPSSNINAQVNTPGRITATTVGVTNFNAVSVGLGNVTNESKATMFANPSFTGSVTGNGQLKLTGSSGLEIQQGFFNSGGIRIKHAASADNEFGIAYEGNTASGEGEKNFKLELKKGGSVLSVIKFKPDGNAFISTGNFGVGKTSPTSKLHVSGNTTLENGVDMATGSNTNYIGIGTTTKDRKVNIDGNVKILKSPENHKANKHVLQTISSDGTGTSVFLGGPTTIVHDLFKNSAVTSGFADMSNHYHTVHRINRITQQDGSASGPNPEVKNIERVQEQYYAIQGNNLRNDKAAFWSWHRVTRDIHVTNLSLTNLSGWNVQNDQDFGYNASSAPGGRKQTEQVAFAASQNTTFTFTSGNNPFSTVGELIRVTVTTDFVGPFVAQSHIAKITAISGDSITVVLYSGNYKSKDEAPLSTGAGTSAQTALVDNFTVDTIDSASYMTTDGNGITVSDDTNRATGFQKILDITFNASHNLVKNDTITILTDGTNGFKQAEVAHVYERPSATRVKLVYGRLFEPAANLSSLATLPQSSLVGILRGTLDGIHRYTTGDQLMTFWGNNTGRFKSYQIGPGSTADGDCIAIGHNTYNKDANTVKIGYDNNMLNIDSAGIDVAGNISATGSLTVNSLTIDVNGNLTSTGNTINVGEVVSGSITASFPGGAAQLKASGAIAQLILEDDDNVATSYITNTGGDLYYTSTGSGTDYGNHAFMTKDTTTNNTKSAIMLIDGVNENVGIGLTTPNSSYKLDVNGTINSVSSRVTTATVNGDLIVDDSTLFVDASTNKVTVGDFNAAGSNTNKQKGKLTVVGSNASGAGLAITHNTSTTDFVEMYYKGTANGSPFIMSRSQTGGAELVLFNNGDVNINGGYRGVTSSASTSKTPDNVGIGVNAATKLNNGSANTNGKPTNKLHIFEKSGLTIGALTNPTLDNATLRIEESTGVNMYMDGNSIYGSDILALGSNTSKDIIFYPGKAESLRLKSDGKVGIGTASPAKTLDVVGSLKVTSAFQTADTATFNVSAFDVFADNLNLNESLLSITGSGATLNIQDSVSGGGVVLNVNSGTNSGAGSVSTSGTMTIAGFTAIADDLSVNNGALYVDASTRRVGIGHTTNPTLTKTLEVNGDALISGDLQVNGTTTTVNQTNLDVSDNIIGLNRGAATNANDSGIIIERGSTGDNAAILWDESEDYFILGTTAGTPASTGAVAVTEGKLKLSELETTGNILTQSINAQGVISGDGDFSGNVNIQSGNLTLTNGAPGNVGIGTTHGAAPSERLEVVGNIKASGDLTVDTDTLKVDSTNHRVGIGVTAPMSALHVKDTSAGSVNRQIRIHNDSTSAGTGAGIAFTNSISETYVSASIDSVREDANASGNLVFSTRADSSASDDNATVARMTINDTGEVGIGKTATTGVELDVSGDIAASGSITAGVNLVATGSINGSSSIGSSEYAAANFPNTTNVRTTAAFDSSGTMVQDLKVETVKVTGAQMKGMTTTATTWLKLLPAPGANKVLVIRDLEIFIDRNDWSPMNGGQLRGFNDDVLIVIETPAKTNGGIGSSNFNYNTFATLQKKFLNHTINNVFTVSNAVDTIIVRDAPAVQTRAYPNVPLLLRPKSSNTYTNLNTYNITVNDDYYFRITYKIMDMSSDFTETSSATTV